MINSIAGFYLGSDLTKYFSLSKNFFISTRQVNAEVKQFGSSLFIKPPKRIRKLINSGNYVAMPTRGIEYKEFDHFYKLTNRTTIGFYRARG